MTATTATSSDSSNSVVQGLQQAGASLRLTLDVTYLLNGEDVEHLKANLLALCERAIGEGMLTGTSAAEVEKHAIDVCEQPDLTAPLVEDGYVDQILDVSTSHIPKRTAVALGENEAQAQASGLRDVSRHVNWHEYGWIMYCCEERMERVAALHPELASLMRYAIDHSCAYLKLDCDGKVLPDMPIFEW